VRPNYLNEGLAGFGQNVSEFELSSARIRDPFVPESAVAKSFTELPGSTFAVPHPRTAEVCGRIRSEAFSAI
jgi:hypothetical protein